MPVFLDLTSSLLIVIFVRICIKVFTVSLVGDGGIIDNVFSLFAGFAFQLLS